MGLKDILVNHFDRVLSSIFSLVLFHSPKNRFFIIISDYFSSSQPKDKRPILSGQCPQCSNRITDWYVMNEHVEGKDLERGIDLDDDVTRNVGKETLALE